MPKYGKTDPSVYQLRDMNRRITRLEKKVENHILRQGRLNAKIASKMADLVVVLTAISVGSADLEEE